MSSRLGQLARPHCRMRAAVAALGLSVATAWAAAPASAGSEKVLIVSTWVPSPLKPGQRVVFENQDGTTMTMDVGTAPMAIGSLKPGYEPVQTPAGPVVGWGMFQLAEPYTTKSGVTLPVGTRAMGRFVLGPAAYTVSWDHFINADGEDLAAPPDTGQTAQ